MEKLSTITSLITYYENGIILVQFSHGGKYLAAFGNDPSYLLTIYGLEKTKINLLYSIPICFKPSGAVFINNNSLAYSHNEGIQFISWKDSKIEYLDGVYNLPGRIKENTGIIINQDHCHLLTSILYLTSRYS